MNGEAADRLQRMAAQAAWLGQRVGRVPQERLRSPAGGCAQRSAIVVHTARRLLATGRLEQAQQFLDAHLRTVDLSGHTGDIGLIDAVVMHTSMLYTSATDRDRQRHDAEFAYVSACRSADLHRRLRAGALFGLITHAQGRYRQAALVRADLLQQLPGPAGDGPIVRARMDLADSLHRGGRCGEAIRHADTAWQAWRQAPERRRTHGTGILVGYLTMLMGCGRDADAHRIAAEALSINAAWKILVTSLIHPPTSCSPDFTGHQPVCARQITAAEDPDITKVIAVEQRWAGDRP